MQIECPHCSTENTIEFGENIKCYECEQSFAGYLYKKFKKPIVGATTALLIGGFGSYKVGTFFEKNRYPINIEYELIDTCINGYNQLLSRQSKIQKANTCICTLDKTMRNISYKDIEKSEPKFSARFHKNMMHCL